MIVSLRIGCSQQRKRANNKPPRPAAGSARNTEGWPVGGPPPVQKIMDASSLPDWLKVKNPQAPAVRREAEEDWGKR